MYRGMTNPKISKYLEIQELKIRYYGKSPNYLISKRSSNLPKKYFVEI